MTEPSRLVVDASALLGLLLDPGQRGARLAELLSGSELHAPALLPFEVADVLRRAHLAGRLSAADAAVAQDDAGRLPIELWPYSVVATRVWQLRGALTAYDASYAALAELLGATLLTADRRLAAAPALRCPVIVP